MSRHQKFLLAAVQEAEESQLEIKHGALIVRGGKAIGHGHNSNRSRMTSIPGDGNMVALHSEVAALQTPSGGFYEAKQARKKLKHADLYVVRLLPLGRKIQGSTEMDPARFGNSKPCVRCLQALHAFGVRRVVFSTGSDKNGEIEFEVRAVEDLLVESSQDGGHCSRGDSSHHSGAARA
eukprot:CAMPEP_0119298104 /NCGR_PEP_ID=MMETSP1333-20130426/313_1 /TAXON_ID=418940 /ORGANISM="Scyphosphaera apsteinii, Strain RCC1455" /LENGTH=178 /DNA_ID=CAMNT_0007299121 /DNA_START=28 /DNA_END=565 /DNA_ORIENTATION=+